MKRQSGRVSLRGVFALSPPPRARGRTRSGAAGGVHARPPRPPRPLRGARGPRKRKGEREGGGGRGSLERFSLPPLPRLSPSLPPAPAPRARRQAGAEGVGEARAARRNEDLVRDGCERPRRSGKGPANSSKPFFPAPALSPSKSLSCAFGLRGARRRSQGAGARGQGGSLRFVPSELDRGGRQGQPGGGGGTRGGGGGGGGGGGRRGGYRSVPPPSPSPSLVAVWGPCWHTAPPPPP